MTDLTCAQGVELLIDYLEGTLSPELSAAVDAHVAGCPRCVAFVEAYRDAPRLMREATVQAFPADLQQSLMTFLRKERGRTFGGG